MKRLLLVSHRAIDQEGGPAARWRAFARYLPAHGWQVEVLSAAQGAGAYEYDTSAETAVAARAALMASIGRASAPIFKVAGIRPDALPLSMLWVPRGALGFRRRLAQGAADVTLATGPPMAGPLSTRVGLIGGVRGSGPSARATPLIVELRDLWAASPAFDAGGRLLSRVEHWLLRAARHVVVCTPEAAADVRARHPDLAARVTEIPNGFDPQLRSIAAASGRRAPHGADEPLTILHSGTLTAARPITPLVDALARPQLAGGFRLVLHGYLSPASLAEVQRARNHGGVAIEVLAPSSWDEAVRRMLDADACLVTQARNAGDATAVASKVYEYLALGKPVLCLSDGGATEALLRRLGADELCARLDSPESIVAALRRLRDGDVRPLAEKLLEPYDRRRLAGQMAALLEDAAGAR